MKHGFSQDWRYAQANKEALISLGMFAVYFVWWYACAYGLGEGDPAEYSYIFGLPEWFFWSCIAGYPIIAIMLWILVRFCFRNMPLDDEGTDDTDTGERQ